MVSGRSNITAHADPDTKTCLEDISQHHKPTNIHQSSQEKGQEEAQGHPGRETPGTCRELLFPHSIHPRDRPILIPPARRASIPRDRGPSTPALTVGKLFCSVTSRATVGKNPTNAPTAGRVFGTGRRW